MGKIKLQGIEVRVRIGLLEEEQFAPQDLYVSLELSYDFSSIRESDEITDGIDYREIVEFAVNSPMLTTEKPSNDSLICSPSSSRKNSTSPRSVFRSTNRATSKSSA